MMESVLLNILYAELYNGSFELYEVLKLLIWKILTDRCLYGFGYITKIYILQW